MTQPPAHDVVCVVASAGGVEALKRVVMGLPADLPATVLVALHVPPTTRSMLTDILRRRSSVPVQEAEDGLPLRPGVVVVARPDRHLLVDGTTVRLGAGPQENGHRPAHDAMLRSAALALGPRVLGVVLTGLLDDGAAGLAAVARYGGRAWVQDPEDAEFPSMPLAALAAVPSARRVRLADLGQEVAAAVTDSPEQVWPDVDDAQRARDLAEVGSARGEPPGGAEREHLGQPSPFACPDCHGVLSTVPDEVLRFRCRTGHAYTAESLLDRQDDGVESALWTAIRILDERAQMCRRLAGDAERSGGTWQADHYRQRAHEAERSSSSLRGLVPGANAGASPAGAPPGA